MFNPINISPLKENPVDKLLESTKLNGFNETKELTTAEINDKLYTEAVFSKGRERMTPLIESMQRIKDELEKELADAEKADKKNKKRGIFTSFDPQKFWRHAVWKDFEDKLREIFGFRSANIYPLTEKKFRTGDDFASKMINAFTYSEDRYPIDGLVTDNGFYDNTHSMIFAVYFTLGVIRLLNADELVAVLLHEFGHNVDPAMVSISYSATNTLSKYITDRNEEMNPKENKLLHKVMGISESLSNFQSKLDNSNSIFAKAMGSVSGTVVSIIVYILIIIISLLIAGDISISDLNPFKGKGWQNRMIERIADKVKNDPDFNHQTYSEAFADNFARMYGMGGPLISGLKKFDLNNEKIINSRYRRERKRENEMIRLAVMMINDIHKTDLHRVNALIKEYQIDLADPNIPNKVKENMREDMNELIKLKDSFENDFSSFQNRINKTLNDELTKKMGIDTAEEEPEKVVESVDGEIIESKKAYEELMKRKETVTSKERSEFYDLFGHSKSCSLAKDKDGYYVYTHRARSKSYPTIDKIPNKDVEFVRSTC